MGRFSGPSPKRHIFMGNDESMIETLGQRAGYMSRADQARCPVRTAEIYTDHSGVQRHQGKKKELKSSQHLTLNQSVIYTPRMFSCTTPRTVVLSRSSQCRVHEPWI